VFRSRQDRTNREVKNVDIRDCKELDEKAPMPELASRGSRGADLAVKARKTLLLVDDDDAIREIGQELLKDMGYAVLVAKDGVEAVEVYRKHGDGVDIVLLDVIMPNMGGYEAYDCLKRIDRNVKVLLWSGANVNAEAREMLKRGCDGFIHKPFNIQKLSRKIREILEAT
jgi:CheY-like chemotaxis protein